MLTTTLAVIAQPKGPKQSAYSGLLNDIFSRLLRYTRNDGQVCTNNVYLIKT
jgi:hypothetical protein